MTTALPLPNVKLDDTVVREVLTWALQGCPAPCPGPFKTVTVMAYLLKHGCRNFVETGTYLGYTTDAVARLGARVVTIELSPMFHELAVKKFAAMPNVRCLLGDSAELLPRILDALDGPALLWLDGHFSEGGTAKGKTDTPILEELEAVFRHRDKRHVVLIDDIRCFGEGDYPKLDDVLASIAARMPGYSVSLYHDMLRIEPPPLPA